VELVVVAPTIEGYDGYEVLEIADSHEGTHHPSFLR
jgi:hypothetical protein